MDDAFDSVDRVDPYHRSDHVKASQPTSPDRRRKFAQELKDRMEEEARRRGQRQDEVIIDQEDSQASDASDERAGDDETSPEPEKTEARVDKTEEESDRSGPHIDLTA